MASPAPTQAAPAEDVPATILIVDDKPANLTAMRAALEGGDFEIDVAASGPEALVKVLNTEYAVILLDVMMPAMDGFEVATLIRQRKRSQHTPIVFLTALAKDVESIFKGYAVGAIDYVTKPVDPDIVRAKVAVFVDLYRTKERLHRQSARLRATERREFDLRLAAEKATTERRYRDLANAVPQILFIASPDGQFKHWNQRWAEYTGRRDSSLDEAIFNDDLDRFRGQWQSALRTGDRVQIELRLRRSDGAYRWHLFRALAETRPGGEIEAWIGTFTDIDERIQSELERARLLRLEAAARQKADQAVAMRDDFISIASHELKSPVTALHLQLQLLCRKVAALAKSHVEVAELQQVESGAAGALRQAERLTKMITEMLDVTRIRVGKLEVHRAPADLRELAQDVVGRFQEEAAGGGGIRLHADEAVESVCDRDRVDQILTNLISNALRYGGGSPVDVTIARTEDEAIMTVSDQGPGIPEDARKRIFKKFERGRREGKSEGLGLGLFITCELVKAHGGVITVDSEVGAGATFTVRLPLGEAEQAAEPAHDVGGSRDLHDTH